MYILYLYNFILAIETRLTLLDDNNNNRTCFLSVVAFAVFFFCFCLCCCGCCQKLTVVLFNTKTNKFCAIRVPENFREYRLDFNEISKID